MAALSGCADKPADQASTGPTPSSTFYLPSPAPPNAATAPFAWAEEDSNPFANGAAVALVHGMAPESALRLLAPDAETPVESAEEVRAWTEQFDYQNYGTALEAGTMGDWTLIVELNGYRVTERDYAARLSDGGGTAVIFYRSVNADMTFAFARSGVVLRQFDPLDAERRYGRGTPLPLENGLQFGTLNPTASALALMQRITGVTLHAHDLLSPGTRVAVGLHPG